MNTTVRRYYKRFREAGGGIVGESALQALRDARTLATFETLEDQGLVRRVAEYETENYFDVFGVPDDERERKQVERSLELYGVYWVKVEYLSPDTEEWEIADSIGMCVYNDPLSAFENCYLPGMMRAAIDALASETSETSEETAACAMAA